MEVMLGGSWASWFASLHDWRLELISVISSCVLQTNHGRHSGYHNFTGVISLLGMFNCVPWLRINRFGPSISAQLRGEICLP